MSESASLSALVDEVQSLETETFEIRDYLEPGTELAAAACSCACGCNCSCQASCGSCCTAA